MAASSSSGPKPLPLSSLPLWPASKSLKQVFEKNFSIGEKLMSHQRPTGIVPRPDVPAFEVRRDLAFIADHTDSLGMRLYQFQDEAQFSCVLVRVLKVHAQPDGSPLFDVEYVYGLRERNWEALPLIEYLISRGPSGTFPFQVKSSVAEQRLLLSELERNARSGKYALGEPSMAGLTRSYLVEIEAEKGKPGLQKRERICAICKAPAMQRCSVCLSAHYCSKDHQREHWVGGHKHFCRNREAARKDGFDAETQSVVFSVLNPVYAESPVSWFSSNISKISGKTSPRLDVSKCPVNLHGDAEFVIKAQMPVENLAAGLPTDIMLYDEKRSFQRWLLPSESVSSAVADKMRVHPQYFGGDKLFLWGKREADNFRIFLGKLPPQEQGW